MRDSAPLPEASGYALSPSLDRLVSWVACEYCDAVLLRAALADGEYGVCIRCGAALYRESRQAHRRLLPLTVAALILFLLVNAFPLVEMNLGGIRTQATPWETVAALNENDMGLMAVLVLATTILFPATELLLMLYLLVSIARQRVPAGAARVLRAIQRIRCWGMVEVLLLAVIVTLVKLSSMAEIIPGAALWSLGALALVQAAMLSFDPRDLWPQLDAESPR